MFLQRSHRVVELAEEIEPVPSSTLCTRIYRILSGDPDLVTLPVVDDGRPVGLVSRSDFLVKFANQYGRALYEGKPIGHLMDANPLIVDVDLDIDALSALILQRNPSALLRGFIVTRDDRYLGIGTSLALLDMSVRQTERRALELDRARQSAEQANLAKSAFLAAMSHELRTPLNAILGFGEMIRDLAFGREAVERYAEYAGDICVAGEHLTQLINDLLDISKIEAGKMEMQREPISLDHAIRDALRTVRVRAERKGVAIERRQEYPGLTLFADQRAVKQILMNLLSNAVKFTPAGGAVTVNSRAVNDDYAEFIVADTGAGIPPEHLEAVFKAFERLDNRLDRDAGGTGLGLPLAKALTEANGGCLSMSSTVDVGTRVVVRLPQRELPADDSHIAACRAAPAVDLSSTCGPCQPVLEPVVPPAIAS